MLPELGDGVARQVHSERQSAYFVGDKPADRLHLHDIGVSSTNLREEGTRYEALDLKQLVDASCQAVDLHQKAVSLSVVLVSRMVVSLQFVEKSDLELVTHEEVEVRGLVQVVSMRFHRANFLKNQRT